MQFHIHDKINLNLPQIYYSNLNFEYGVFKSWLISNSSFLDWCETLQNETLYSFVIFNFFILLSLINNSLIFEKFSNFFKIFLPVKIITESIFIYFILKIFTVNITNNLLYWVINSLQYNSVLLFIVTILLLIIFCLIYYYLILLTLIIINQIIIKIFNSITLRK